MFHPAVGLIAGGILLLASIPYVARIRHPEQKPFAAYLIFVSIFAVASVVLFGMLTVVAGTLGLTEWLAHPVPVVAFLLMAFVPALLLARWQARKPPWRQGPPP